MVGITVSTQCRLCDPASLNLHAGRVLAHVALEEGLSHLGNQGR